MPLQIRENRADVSRPGGHFERHELLDGFAVAQVVARRSDVVHPVRDEHDLRPVAVLAQLFDPAVQIPDDDVTVDDALAIEPQHHPEHAVRAGMLRSHVEDELAGVKHFSFQLSAFSSQLSALSSASAPDDWLIADS